MEGVSILTLSDVGVVRGLFSASGRDTWSLLIVNPANGNKKLHLYEVLHVFIAFINLLFCRGDYVCMTYVL